MSELMGHIWTIAPVLRHRVRPRVAPPSVPWSTVLSDPERGEIRLRGRFSDRREADAALLVVHGLGGTTDTHYCVAAARAADAAGLACLRLALRGADREGEDFYHAGLTRDLEAALGSPQLARFARLYVLGYSLGGHVTLRYALSPEPRVRAVAAVCPPLDLELSARHIDSARATVYRRHVLSGLNAIYGEASRRGPVPTPLREVLAARTIREWDSLTVVPRYGFGTVERYYATMSVGPQLPHLAVPALLLPNRYDPMVPEWSYREHLERPAPRLTVRYLPAGGHVGYPEGIDLGEQASRGVEPQLLAWLLRQ